MKIRLHSWNAKCNHKISESDITCSICRIEEDITKRKMVYQERNNTLNELDENEKKWEKIVTIYKNDKENREKLEQQERTEGKDIQKRSSNYNGKVN